MMIPEPEGVPQPKKVHLIKSAASQQYVRKISIMPPAKSSILPLLSPYSTISILSLLPVTPEFSSTVTKDLRQKGRKYVSSFSSDESSSSKQSLPLEWKWYPTKSRQLPYLCTSHPLLSWMPHDKTCSSNRKKGLLCISVTGLRQARTRCYRRNPCCLNW